MKFNFPELPRGAKISAVYKMIFDGGYFYIGSALNLKQRMNGWKFKMSNGIFKNHKVGIAFKNTTTVTFEILEVVDDPVFRRYREDGYIKINFGNELCLNIAPSAYNSVGVKHTNPNKKKRPPNYSQMRKVAKIDDNGHIVELYSSVKEANEKNSTNCISDCFKDNRRKVKGSIFRLLDDKNNIIPAPTVDRKPRKRKGGYKISEIAIVKRLERNAQKRRDINYRPPKQAKPIIQMDVYGNIISTHLSIQAAARTFNGDVRNFKRQINKSPRNYYKGFIWKYA